MADSPVLATTTAGRQVPVSSLTWPRVLARSTALWIFVVDGILAVVLAIFTPSHDFWSILSFQSLGIDAAEGLLLGVGVAMLLGAGELDISLGATLVLASVIGGQVAAEFPSNLLLAGVLGALACIAVGAALGIIKGIVVTKLGVNSLITTLAVVGIATGVADLRTNGADLANIPQGLQSGFGSKLVLQIPLPALISLVIWAIAWLAVSKTRFGLRLVSMGSSRDAAVRAGLRIARHLTVAFVLASCLAGVAAFFDITRFDTTNIGGHETDALAAITAAVIGGTPLSGGRISIPGVLAGTLLAVMLELGLIELGLQAFWQPIVVGIVLIIAVYIDQRRHGSDGRKLFARN